MPGILRLNDIDNANDRMVECSSKVFSDGVGVCFEKHKDSNGDTCDDVSSMVFVEGKGVAFISLPDPPGRGKDSRRNLKITGSPNVIVGI